MAMVLLLVLMPVVTASATNPTPPVGGLISNSLGGGFTATALPSTFVTLSWGTQPTNVFVGRSFNMSVRATSLPEADGGRTVNKALFVITATKTVGAATEAAGPGDVDVKTTGGVPLGYDSAGGFFYFGPRTGFEMTPNWDVTTEFVVTPKAAGTYSFIIQCVDLEL
jgi:hypothetical protein